MTEYVGRTGAKRNYSYPENPRAAALGLFARNFATGPKLEQTITGSALVQWNAVDALSTSSPFTVAAGGVTVTIPGDATGLFTNGDRVIVTPTAPAALPPVNSRTVASVPAFALGVTTFDLSAPIDGTTTAGTIDDQVNVPITPRATGIVLISGVVTVQNGSGSPVAAELTIQVDGTPIPVPAFAGFDPLADGETVTIPFLAETTIPIGETHNVQILVTANGADLIADASALSIQEVSVATG